LLKKPKSLFRQQSVVSSFEDCAEGMFQRVLPDRSISDPAAVRQIMLCCGKIYYELEKQREELKRTDTAILRMEQLYPMPLEPLKSALSAYPDGCPVVWVQEEPENMGPWRYLRVNLGENLFGRFPFSGVTRPASASPATGSANSHKQEQSRLLAQAFGLEKG
jgi:2-oxoglutarate dehydrogenase E1 component